MPRTRSNAFSLTIFVIATVFCAHLINCSGSDSIHINNPGVATDSGQPTHPDAQMPAISSEGARADGVGSGGGGDVVVCYDENGNIKDMESFDIWASWFTYRLNFSRLPLGQNNDVSDRSVNYMDIVNEKIRWLNKFDPQLARNLSDVARGFSQTEIDKKTNIHQVPYIHINGDGGAVIVPNATFDCFRVTHERMFWQFDQPKAHQYTYQLVEKLWANAPERVKAAVVLHESIWKFERARFAASLSVNTQYLNAVINSNEFLNYTLDDYVNLLRSITDAQGSPWSQNSLFSYQYGEILFQAKDFQRISDTYFYATPFYPPVGLELGFVSGGLFGSYIVKLDNDKSVILGRYGQADGEGRLTGGCSLRVQELTLANGQVVRVGVGDFIRVKREDGLTKADSVVREHVKCSETL